MSNRNRARKRRASNAPAVAQRPAAGAKQQPKQERAKPTGQTPKVERPDVGGPKLGHWPWLGAGAVTLIALAIYAATVQRSVPTGDSGELITAAALFGIAHPPGYPLFTMLGHIATLLPGGSPALRVNLMSGLFDALAVGLVFIVIYRLVAIGRDGALVASRRFTPYVAAAVGSLMLAFSSIFWAYSVVAEVFALNNFFAALLMLVAFEWARRPQRVGLLWLFMLLFGLALCDQQTIVLLLPAFVVLAVAGWRRLPPRRGSLRLTWRQLGFAAGAFVAGLLPYLYLPIAASQKPGIDWDAPTSFSRFWYDVSRGGYGSGTLVTGAAKGSVVHNLVMLFSNLAEGFVYAGLVLAVLGCWWAWRHLRAEGTALAVAFLVAGPLFLAYADTGFPDQLTKGILARFYILPSVPLAMLVGLGAWWLLGLVESRSPARYARAIVVVTALALLALPVASAATHYSAESQSSNNVERDYVKDLLGPLPRNSILLMRGDQNYTGVVYEQLVEHYRPDVIALDTELLKLAPYVAQVRQEHPSLLIPFTVFQPGPKTSILNQFVRANLPEHPVFNVGAQVENDFGKPFSTEYWGLTVRALPKGQAPNINAYEAEHPSVFSALHWPTHVYPQSSWEGWAIGGSYANAAFDFATALQTQDGSSQLQLAERMYRESIFLDPSQAAKYKDLGLLLEDNGGDPKEIISLWTKYLKLDPTDPQAPAIRTVLNRLEAQQKKKAAK